MLAPWAVDEVARAKFGDKRLDARMAIAVVRRWGTARS